MERGFQSLFLTGKNEVGDYNFPPIATSDETYINRELSYLIQSYEKSMLSSLNYPYESSNVSFDGTVQSTKRKTLIIDHSTESLMNFSPATVFGQLPDLRSVENQQERRLRQKFSPVETIYFNQQMLESTLMNFQLKTNYFTPALNPPQQQPQRPPSPPPPAKLSVSEVAYQRRRKISDKTQSLQKLLPVDKKMDIATIYEETYKYITFLKAQITVLKSMSMPVSSSSSSNFRSENPRYGRLGKLNREQLLEVFVNSPAAQSTLYSKGCCIYSLDQLKLFNDVVEKSMPVSDH